MTPGEKVAAEWEARHDVRARGPQGSAAPVQLYLQHARREEHRHATAARPHAVPTAPAEPPPAPAPKESWWHRLFRRPRG
jgi:hypothetical protein